MMVIGVMPGFSFADGGEVGKLLISELNDPKSNYQQDRFVEIYNTTEEAIVLDGWKLEIIENTAVARTFNLTGTLASGDAYVVGIEGYEKQIKH